MSIDLVKNDKQQLNHVLVELLKTLDEVCQRYNIKYFVFAGTMLGAIRHKGIIPWDDDVDVVLWREDYNRLIQAADEGAFQPPFFFQNPNTDPGYPKGYCRLRNSNTTEIPIVDVYEKCNHGIFIDIFPLDNIPDDEVAFSKQIKKLKRMRNLMNVYARHHAGIGTLGASAAQSLAYHAVAMLFKTKILSMKSLYGKYESIATRYSNSRTKRVGTIAGLFDNQRFIFARGPWESKPIRLDFEDIKVPVPESYDEILKHSYGDYLTPKQERTNHGETFFSATIPYEKYIEDNKHVLLEKRYKLTNGGKKK